MKTDTNRLLLALGLLLILDAGIFFYARPLFWVSTVEEKASVVGEFIGSLIGAFILASGVAMFRRWRGRKQSMLLTGVIAMALATTSSVLTYGREASSSYEPHSKTWLRFANGCSSTCRQSGQSVEVCVTYCECAAQAFLGTFSKLEANRYLAAIESGGSRGKQARDKLTTIIQQCAKSLRN